MNTRWTEMAPQGPQIAGDIGGDLQDTEAFSRRWYRELPRGNGYMVLTVAMYGMQDAGRRWITTDMEFGRALVEPQSIDDIEYLSEESSDSAEDRSVEDGWPTDEDIKEELARYPITIHDAWEGN